MSAKLGKLTYDEPPMYLQRPSSGRSQDVTHVLARTFRDIFTRDLVEQETVKNLNKSRSGDDSYHEKYVEELRKVQAERERRMAEAAMLERHIMQARAKAMAEDEKILNRAAEGCDIYHDLGLPPVQSNLNGCLDSDLLRSHGLIVPEDFSTAEPPLTHAPQAGVMPHYAEATQTSTKHIGGGEKGQAHDATDNGPLKKRSGQKNESKNKWREMTSPQTRERNRKDMAMVFSKSNFLRNPRHRPPSSQGGGRTLVNPNTITHKLGGAKSTVIDTGKKEPSVVFVPSPSTIVFSNYKVGQVYEMTLDLKNVSAASRPLRVLPPKTEYFAVGLGKFPGEEGIVAPGMSCQYNIRFMPDALMDFEDELTVSTQSSQPITVKLLGKRPPPLLTLSPVVDCGHCLVDGPSNTEFLVRNLGGSGRFCVMPRKCWPATNFSSVATGDRVNLPPFQLYPAVFEIMEGHAIPLQVSFKPTDTQIYEEEITVVCDNCTVKHFILKGEGQRARVLLESASGSETNPTPGELVDVTAKNHIRFEDINPMTYVTEELTIRNLTNVELPFHWQLVRSSPECRDPFREGKKDGQQISRVADERNIFCINMEKGVLPPSGTAVTSVAFAPPKMGQFESVLQLVLKNIPRPAATRKVKSSSSHPRGSLSSSQSGDTSSKQPPVCSTPRPTSHTASQAFITQREDGDDDGGGGGGGSGGGGGGGMGDGGVGEHAEEGDSLGLEVELKGVCKEYEVLVQPYAVFVPGQVLQSTATRRKFTMLNYSKFPIVFHWSSLKDSHIIEVQTPEGQIPPESSVELEMTIIGGHPGHIDHTLHCVIDHQESTVPLRVVADVKGPEVSIETPSLDFGLVRLGQTVRKQFYLTNESQVSARWNLKESEEFLLKDQQSGQSVSEFTITPSSGELGPLLSVLVEVVLSPTRRRQIDSVMELTVEGGKTRYVGVYGEVQSPQVCVLESTLELPEIYQGIPVTHTVQLFNQTMLPASYQWQQPKGKQSSICSVTFDPEQGILGPHEQLPVSVTIVAKEQGPLSDVWIPCLVSGMVKPIFLALVGDVQGLRVTYRTPEVRPSTALDTGNRLSEEPSKDDAPLALDFGDDVELANTPKRLVYLTNHTAIPAPFSLTVDMYSAGKPPTPPQTDRPTADSPRRHGALLSRTANLADPRSKSLAQSQTDSMKAILREGQGAAFLVQPCSGILEPFATLEVAVTAYSDMWGNYTDQLNCEVSNLEPVCIPISLGVTGCPLKFQMATIRGQIPFVRFGTHICGVPSINRPLKIMNNSPYEMRVDWRLFNLMEDDRKLIDLQVIYGDPFPILDPSGAEVIAEDDDDVLESDQKEDGDPETGEEAAGGGGGGGLLSKIADDLEASEKDRPKVLSVLMREHEGVPADGPFSIDMKQMVIPGRGTANIVASFTPEACHLLSQRSSDCVGYALGYLSLDQPELRGQSGSVTRGQAFEVPPLRLDFTAYIKTAFVSVETSEEEGLTYRTAASQLLDLDPPIPPTPTLHDRPSVRPCSLHPCHLTSLTATLTNNTQTPLSFQAVTPLPFLLQRIDPVTKKTKKGTIVNVRSEATEAGVLYSLPTQKNLQVKLGFQLDLALIMNNLEQLCLNESKEGVLLTCEEGERKLHIHKDLLLCYTNSTVQKLPLYAVIVLPSIELTPWELDFGVCLVGQERSLKVTISNRTSSGSYWTVSYDSHKTTSDNVFEVSPPAGYLEPHITHVSDSKTILTVYFTPPHSISYAGTFVFRGLLGEETRHLQVRGQGTYDSRQEALVNP
ncbi:deleted in lung and esophageal cancer protein 1 isoform X1 [Strongylocentrotus purpuratus]|uniref:Deleted in lung and esophageal cancer protein 1 n=1 Tax=Strongylocentrotus purpuratus TaxID=7668 RepID=A0A7M7PBI8_STRPU|nr:deleted in lung and esophageal cancer protein 1 isoform X1 [Strongylocentrotus purpuratus]XP_030846691.1 deleted in lung and esophageal cancer protein 1 isoform X1 [Strongylocentrotus purpuratus]XP_030846692.1 deleted in lung and esophageal cancer protein 1 isoform X1 [Strongylocentrotus purpuratus]